jgi:succinoglycan biosynthesis protein ExoO
MANYNCAAFLPAAIASAQHQSSHDIEIIVSDDGSTDASLEVIAALVEKDPRIRLLRSECNNGPGSARNKALAVARGEWIAIMDSDDLMHPDRLAKLVEAAGQDGADIVADDLVEFDADISRPRGHLLTGSWAKAPFWVDIKDYLRLNQFYGPGPALGYLKPVFRRSLLDDLGASYDETLRIGEDFDLVLRLLRLGKTFRVYPLRLYYYRRRQASTSYRLNEEALTALKIANLRFLQRVTISDQALASAVESMSRSIEIALAFERLLRALKSRNWWEAFAVAIKEPRAAALLRLPISLRLWRILGLRHP